MKEEKSRQQRRERLSVSCKATGVCYWILSAHHVLNLMNEVNLTFSSDAPNNISVSISPSGLVSAGSWVNLTCSSRAKPPASFSWFKNSKDGAVSVAEGDFYSFKVTSVTDIEDYYCVATNDLGNQTFSWIHLKSAGK